MKIKTFRTAISLFAAAAFIALPGCGDTSTTDTSESSAEPTTAVETTTEAEPSTEAASETSEKEELKTIGEKQEGDAVCTVTLSNKTGKNIIGFSVKSEDEEEYPENMLPDSESFEKNEERVLYFKTEEKEYTVKIVFDDDTEAELHSFPFGDIEEGTIKLEDDVAYLIYDSVSQNAEVNTRDDEFEAAEISVRPTGHEVIDNTPDLPEPQEPKTPVATDPPAPAPVVTEPPVEDTPAVGEPDVGLPDNPPVIDVPADPVDPNDGCIGGGGLFY